MRLTLFLAVQIGALYLRLIFVVARFRVFFILIFPSLDIFNHLLMLPLFFPSLSLKLLQSFFLFSFTILLSFLRGIQFWLWLLELQLRCLVSGCLRNDLGLTEWRTGYYIRRELLLGLLRRWRLSLTTCISDQWLAQVFRVTQDDLFSVQDGMRKLIFESVLLQELLDADIQEGLPEDLVDRRPPMRVD